MTAYNGEGGVVRVLVLGVSGMLGSQVFSTLLADPRYEVWGTLRNSALRSNFSSEAHARILDSIDVLEVDTLLKIFLRLKPEVVVNCVGMIKQLSSANDPLVALPVNSLFPHRLAAICGIASARLVHISTDCVFSGADGDYREADPPDAGDVYGVSKRLGEVCDLDYAVTLRTSIIGHELSSSRSLVDWFLSQSGQVKGYASARFSGLPTIELARVLADYVLRTRDLAGLYHVSADPIDKFSLLKLISNVYGKEIDITPDHHVVIDRSLNSSRFRSVTGYEPPSWPELVKAMHASYRDRSNVENGER